MTRQLNGQLACNSDWLSRLRISVISVSCGSYGMVLLERGTTHFPRITEASKAVHPVFWVKSKDIHTFGEGILLYSVSV